jgi:heme/copper-type cytochrome/quinol oxidase subunit 2
VSFSYMYIIFGISIALIILLLLFFVLINLRKNKNIQTRDVSLPGDALEDHARISALEQESSLPQLL